MKFIDIKKPAPRKKTTYSNNYQKSNSTKTNKGVFFFFIIVFLVIILYFSNNNSHNTDYQKDDNYSKNIDDLVTVPSESSTPALTTNDIIATPTPSQQSTLNNLNNTSATVLNGSGKPGLAQHIKTLLDSSGIVVDDIGNATNLYKKTVIYCEPENEIDAKYIQNILSDYPSDIDMDSTISSLNHITIVVGEEQL